MGTTEQSPAPAPLAPLVPARERRALQVSLAFSILIGAIGIVWGVLGDSRIVLFDGVYTLFGTALSGLSLLAAWIASRDATDAYPFGREAIIPVAIVLQGAALLGTLVIAFFDSVTLLFSGGTEAAKLGVIGYAVLTGVLSLVVIWWLPRLAPGSELVAAERDQWRAGAVLSALIALGAAATLGLVQLGLHWLAPYGDPLLVIMATIGLAPLAWGLLRSGGRELLEAAPPQPLREAIERAAAEVGEQRGLPTATIRSTKLGRRLYVEVDYLVAAGVWDVSDEDGVRRDLIGRLEALGHEVWANVELTTDPELAC